jgi:metal-sulfur cluster biosynthetic enzyme
VILEMDLVDKVESIMGTVSDLEVMGEAVVLVEMTVPSTGCM